MHLGPEHPKSVVLHLFEGQQIIRGLRSNNLVGADLVEVSPPFDQSGNTALVAATMVYEILCVLSENVTST